MLWLVCLALAWGVAARENPALPGTARNPRGRVWHAAAALVLPGKPGDFDEIAVKDPSIVRHGGKWHLFYSARGNGQYGLGYTASETLDRIGTAPRVPLSQLRGATPYGAAPQVFWFEPKRKWYLIFQTADSNYQPVYSESRALDRPENWSLPRPLAAKVEKNKWIDFWVICDDARCHLFYTRDQHDLWMMSTRVEDFPAGFGGAQPVFTPLHEAAHIYKVKGENLYLMLFENNRNGVRSYGLAAADRLAGPWTKAEDEFATGEQLRYPAHAERWASDVSHGELMRSGCDQHLEIDPGKMEFLIQSTPAGSPRDDYPSIRWRLGIITRP